MCYEVNASTAHKAIKEFRGTNGGKYLAPSDPELVNQAPKTGKGGTLLDSKTLWYKVRVGWTPLKMNCANMHILLVGHPLRNMDCETMLLETFDHCE